MRPHGKHPPVILSIPVMSLGALVGAFTSEGRTDFTLVSGSCRKHNRLSHRDGSWQHTSGTLVAIRSTDCCRSRTGRGETGFVWLAQTYRFLPIHAMVLEAGPAAKTAGRAQQDRLGQGNTHDSPPHASIRLLSVAVCTVNHISRRRTQVPQAGVRLWARIFRQVPVFSTDNRTFN